MHRPFFNLLPNQIKIAHRGNIRGPFPDIENSQHYVNEAILKGYHAEIDVWFLKNTYFTGHDKPEHIVSPAWLTLNKNVLWCHAKNVEAIGEFMRLGMNVFWHETDQYTLTSHGFIWCYPLKQAGEKSIAVMPESVEPYDLSKFYGICSDWFEY